MALSRDADSLFPALGAGKLGGVENMLIQAPEDEEDFDVLNDETFGDLGDADYDWEDEHERLAEEMEGASFFDSQTQISGHERSDARDSGFLTMDRGHSSVVQDELEQSLTRLVVEDGDNKNFDDNGQPIPGALRRSHLDELFGPNSPPGYLDLESLNSRRNIWGSPSADSPFQKPVNNTLQALFASAKQAAFRDIPGVFQDARASPVQHPPAMPLPPEVPTLAEIENSMLARESNKPQVLTAEELERQLRGEPPLPTDHRQPSLSSPMAIPPVGTSVAFRKQLGDVPSKPNQGPGGYCPRVLNGESSPINIIHPQARALQSFHNQESPLQSAASPSASPSPSTFPPGMVPSPALMAQSPRMVSPYNPTIFMEYCSDDTYCDTPSKCCETKRGCCFDSMLHGRHFRLHEWNMWYFWFLIIFMMMSCFGGCGYYRRRRLAMLSRSPVSSAAHTSSVTLSHNGGIGQRAQERRARRFNYFAYNGPGNMGIFPMPQYIQEPSVTSLPPAYSEVVNQPSLYPVNDKTGLPPYPGLDKPENGQVLPVAAGGASVWPIEDSNLPPPYTESVCNPRSEQQPPVQQPVDPHESSLSRCTSQPLSPTPNADSVVQATPGDGSNQEGLSVVVAPGNSNNSTRLGLP